MGDSTNVCDVAQAVAEIVQQQGHHDFLSYEDEVRLASLCGLSVFIENGKVIRIKAGDLDFVFGSPSHFLQGNETALGRWYDRLTRFQTVFSFTPHVSLELGATEAA